MEVCKKNSVLLVDDHGIIRQGLRSLLEETGELEVIAEASNGHEALDAIAQCKPDVVICDISMPGLNGIDATREIVNQYHDINVIALSIHSDHLFVADMLKAGARGYVLKECLFGELLDAIETVIKNGTYLSPKVAGVVVSDYVRRLGDESDRLSSPLDVLSTRQREILQLIGEGYTTRQMASLLNISTKAIEACRRKIMDKLDVYTVAELVKVAIVGGLTSIEDY